MIYNTIIETDRSEAAVRILMLSQFYPPIVGGEEQHVRSLSRELVRRGHDVIVATLWNEGLAEFEMDEGVRVYRIRSTMHRASWLFSESGRRHAPPFPDLEALLALRRVIEKEQPDVVHAHNWLLHSFLPLKSWSKARLVVTLHDYSFRCAKKRLMYQGAPCSGPGILKCMGCSADHYGMVKGIGTLFSNWAMSAVERSAVDMFIAVSQATAAGNGLVESGLPFQVIPNFVPDDFEARPDESDSYLAQLPKEGFLLFVGDVSVDKGVGVLMRAYYNLKDAPPLVIIGRRFPEIPTAISGKVIFLDSWPNKAVMRAWHRSSIAIVPSLVPETFGIVVIEAMASGRPVVASQIGGLPDIVVDGETGFLVPPGDANALQKVLERLLSDPELRERMGQAGRRKAIEFYASMVVPRIEQVYQTVIEAEFATKRMKRLADEDQGSWNPREL